MIGRHAGGTIRAVVLLVGPAVERRPPTTPAAEWTGEKQCRTGRTWRRNDLRASIKRTARRRAAKGYHYEAAKNL